MSAVIVTLGFGRSYRMLRNQRPIARRLNISQRFARVAAFFLFACDDGIAWLEFRRLYWLSFLEPETGRTPVHWQPLKLPSQHHPETPPPRFFLLILVVVLVLFFLR